MPGFELREIVSRHVGGRTATIAGRPTSSIRLPLQPDPFPIDPNGEFAVEQIYAQSFRLAAPRFPLPVMLWHGGGLTGALWDAKADGSPGWLNGLLEAGIDVTVTDAVGMGRSSWGHQPEVFPPQALFRSKREAWELFRIGPSGSYASSPAERRAFPGQQFPVEHFDSFAMGIQPRWVGMEAAVQAAFGTLLNQAGRSVVVAHSSATAVALEAARANPAAVAGLCLVEPATPPPWPDAVVRRVLAEVPCLFVFGDHFDASPYWRGLRLGLDAWRARIGDGLPIGWLDLPAQGLAGNSHCPMADANADLVLARILVWIRGCCR